MDTKSTNEHDIHEALDSFYSDIASLEVAVPEKCEEPAEKPKSQVAERNQAVAEVVDVQSPRYEEKTTKKKKKVNHQPVSRNSYESRSAKESEVTLVLILFQVKLDSSLSLKKKGLEGLVAKWQKVSADGRI